MMKLYSMSKDYHFDPLISDAMRKLINDSFSIANEDIEAKSDVGYSLVKLLKETDKSKQGEVIITYEILYNIAEKNTSFSEIIDYLNNNNLDVSFSSLEKFINASLSDSDESSFKLFLLKTGLSIEPIKYINIKFDAISWKWDKTLNFTANIKNLFSIFEIKNMNITILGNFDTYLQENNFLFPIYSFTSDGSGYEDFLPESIDKYMIKPIYNPTGSEGAFMNERYAVEAYNERLKSAATEIEAPLFNNDIFSNMWNIIIEDKEYLPGLSNNRTYNQGSLLYMPSIRALIYDNSAYNDFAYEAINIPQFDKDNKFTPFLGREKVTQITYEVLSKAIELIDKRNLECRETSKNLSSQLGQFTKMIVELRSQIALERIGFRKKTYDVGAEDPVSAEEALAYYEDAATKVRDALSTIVSQQLDYYDFSGDFMVPDAFKEKYKEAFKNKNNIETAAQWDRMQYYYSLAPFFKYDSSNEKDFMDKFYADMKVYNTVVAQLSEKLVTI